MIIFPGFLGSISTGIPSSILDGLVLYLDAGSPASYPGTGTVWYDLSGLSNNANLVNGPTFDNQNGGSIVFDGTDDFIVATTSSIPISTTISVCVWIKHDTLPSSVQRYLTVGSDVAVIRHDGQKSVGQLHFYITTNGTLKLNLRVNNSLVTNTWYNIVGTWDGTTMRLYKNSIDIGTNVPGGTLDGGNLNYFASSGAEPLDGNISLISIYNKALTQLEITQKFNAVKARFGL